MELIPCAACEKRISQMATSCPNCGHPVVAAPPARPEIQTVEQTSKRFKAGQLVGAAMLLWSFVACSAGNYYATSWILVLGLVIWLVSRTGAWWNNG
jgi:DNA-directed RNA polymerase subunit RPC12/RpoP